MGQLLFKRSLDIWNLLKPPLTINPYSVPIGTFYFLFQVAVEDLPEVHVKPKLTIFILLAHIAIFVMNNSFM